MKTPAQIYSFFGCSPDQLRAQYAKNAASLSKMADKADATGRKVNGYTASELRQNARKLASLAK